MISLFLNELYLNYNQISKIEGLDSLANLQYLDLNNNPLQDQVAGLASLPALATVGLENTQASGSLASIAAANWNSGNGLDVLLLFNSQVNGSLADLAPMTSLTELSLGNTSDEAKVSGDISDLAPLADLYYLSLAGQGISGSLGALAADINRQNRLGALLLNQTQVSGTYADVAKLTGLEVLYLSDMDFGENLSPLSALPNLNYLYLPHMGLSSLDGFSPAIGSLLELNLDGNHLGLSQLDYARTLADNYHLGQQSQALWKDGLVLSPGQVKDLSAEAMFDNQATQFTALDANGNVVDNVISLENGQLAFTKAGNYYLAMTNPALLSNGWVVVYDPALDMFVYTNVYGRHNFGSWFVGAQLGLGYAMVDNHRSIPAIGTTAKSDYDMYWYQAGLAAGYDFRVGDNAIISPSLGFAWLGSHSQGFSEKNAGNLNLDVDSENLNSFELQALVDAETTLVTDGGMQIKPRLKLGLAYELADKNASIHTRFTEIPEIGAFEAESADVGRLRFIGGLGLDMSLSETVSLLLDYETSLQQDYHYHQGSVSLKFEF